MWEALQMAQQALPTGTTNQTTATTKYENFRELRQTSIIYLLEPAEAQLLQGFVTSYTI